MVDPYQNWQPILPYPSRKSVAMTAVEMIVRRSGLDTPAEEFYSLSDLSDVETHILFKAVDAAIRRAEPGERLQEELSYFESVIVEGVVNLLEDGKIGQAVIDVINSSAYARYYERHNQVEG